MKIIALFVLTFFLAVSAHAAQYRVHYLGVLPGDVQSVAGRINERGQVVGSTNTSDLNSPTGTFVWSQSTGMTRIEMGGMPYRGGGINDTGQIAGGGYVEAGMHASIRGTDGLFTPLPEPSGDITSIAADINNLGQVVGFLYDQTDIDNDRYYAVLWDTNGKIVTLGGGDDMWSRASDINNVGQAVWTRDLQQDWPATRRAYRWDCASGSLPLALLDGTYENSASAINDAGWVVGSSGTHAVLWTSPSTAVDLGTVEDAWAGAFGINNRGQIVGTMGGRAVLWDADGRVAADLGSVLDTTCWSAAHAINDRGWIVGCRLDEHGNQQAVVWEPIPEPSSLLALGMGVLSLPFLSVVRKHRVI